LVEELAEERDPRRVAAIEPRSVGEDIPAVRVVDASRRIRDAQDRIAQVVLRVQQPARLAQGKKGVRDA